MRPEWTGAAFGRDDDAGILVYDDLRRLHDRLQDLPGGQAEGDAVQVGADRAPLALGSVALDAPGVAEELPAGVPRAARRHPFEQGDQVFRPPGPDEHPFGFLPGDPVAEELHGPIVDAVGDERGHLTAAAPREAMDEDGTIRGARRDEHRVGNSEAVVLRPGPEEPHLLPRGGEGQLHRRVSAAGLDMTGRAVHVQIGAGSRFEVPGLVARVDELIEFPR
jgi:hypothetical protein